MVAWSMLGLPNCSRAVQNPPTAQARLLSLKRFSAWLTDEGELDHDPLLAIKPPKLTVKVVAVLTDDQLRDRIKACVGKSFPDRRDEAIVRLMAETGLRAAELCALTTKDLDLIRGHAVVLRGKGGKGQVVPFGPQTATAVDRYVRMRRAHRLAGTDALWLGERSRSFGYMVLYGMLTSRAALAGLDGFHPHVLRNTAATRWSAAGGCEGGLMAVAG